MRQQMVARAGPMRTAMALPRTQRCVLVPHYSTNEVVEPCAPRSRPRYTRSAFSHRRRLTSPSKAGPPSGRPRADPSRGPRVGRDCLQAPRLSAPRRPRREVTPDAPGLCLDHAGHQHPRGDDCAVPVPGLDRVGALPPPGHPGGVNLAPRRGPGGARKRRRQRVPRCGLAWARRLRPGRRRLLPRHPPPGWARGLPGPSPLVSGDGQRVHVGRSGHALRRGPRQPLGHRQACRPPRPGPQGSAFPGDATPCRALLPPPHYSPPPQETAPSRSPSASPAQS